MVLTLWDGEGFGLPAEGAAAPGAVGLLVLGGGRLRGGGQAGHVWGNYYRLSFFFIMRINYKN